MGASLTFFQKQRATNGNNNNYQGETAVNQSTPNKDKTMKFWALRQSKEV